MSPVPQPTASAVVVLVGCVAAVADLRTRRIPNTLTASTALGGFIWAAVAAGGVSPGAAAAGLVIGLLLMLPGYALGATGAGDVKLMAALGTWLGPGSIVAAFLFTAVAGGAIAAAVAVRRRRAAAMLAGMVRLAAVPSTARDVCAGRDASHRFAYGPAIALGSLAALWWR